MLRCCRSLLGAFPSHSCFPAMATDLLPTAASSSVPWGWDRQLSLQAAAALASQCSSSGRTCSSNTSNSSSSSAAGYATSAAPPGAAGAAAANAPLADPWVPTSQLIKRKTYQKRSRHLIQVLEREQVQRLSEDKQLPQFRSGDILEVTTVVPEADRKVYTYKGVCIARANKGPRSWFKIYNVFPDVGGFVQHFPLYMPDMVSVKVVGRLPRAKRSKLYHLLRDEGPKHIYQTNVALPQ